MEDEVMERLVEEIIRKATDEQLRLLTQMVAGLSVAMTTLIGALDRKGALTLDEAELALRSSLAVMPQESVASQSGQMLHRLLESIDAIRRGETAKVLH